MCLAQPMLTTSSLSARSHSVVRALMSLSGTVGSGMAKMPSGSATSSTDTTLFSAALPTVTERHKRSQIRGTNSGLKYGFLQSEFAFTCNSFSVQKCNWNTHINTIWGFTVNTATQCTYVFFSEAKRSVGGGMGCFQHRSSFCTSVFRHGPGPGGHLETHKHRTLNKTSPAEVMMHPTQTSTFNVAQRRVCFLCV